MKKLKFILVGLLVFLFVSPQFASAGVEEDQLNNIIGQIKKGISNIQISTKPCMNRAFLMLGNRMDEMVGAQAFLGRITNPIEHLLPFKWGLALGVVQVATEDLDDYLKGEGRSIISAAYGPGWIRRLSGEDCENFNLVFLWLKELNIVRIISSGNCNCNNDLRDFYIQFDVEVRPRKGVSGDEPHKYEVINLYNYDRYHQYLTDEESEPNSFIKVNCCEKCSDRIGWEQVEEGSRKEVGFKPAVIEEDLFADPDEFLAALETGAYVPTQEEREEFLRETLCSNAPDIVYTSIPDFTSVPEDSPAQEPTPDLTTASTPDTVRTPTPLDAIPMPSSKQSSSSDIAVSGVIFKSDELGCGFNSISGEIKKTYKNNYCEGEMRAGRTNEFNYLDYPVEETDGRVKEMCEILNKASIKEKLIEKYNSISCPSRCPVKIGPMIEQPRGFCEKIRSGSNIGCDSALNFNCERLEDQPPLPGPTPCPSPSQLPIESHAPIPGLVSSFSGDLEPSCQPYLNTIIGKVKKIYPGSYCGKSERSRHFDPTYYGEETATELCEKGAKWQLLEKYNSIKCPVKCPVKTELKIYPPMTFCEPLRTDSVLECISQINFVCKEPCPSATLSPIPTNQISPPPTLDIVRTPTPSPTPKDVNPSIIPTPTPDIVRTPTPSPADVNPSPAQSSCNLASFGEPCDTHGQYKYSCSGNTLNKYFCDKVWTAGDPCYYQKYWKKDTTSTCNFGCTAGQAASNIVSPGIIWCQDKCEQIDASTVKIWAGKGGNYDLTNSGYCESSYPEESVFMHYKHWKYTCLKQYSSSPSEGDGTLYQKTITDCGPAKRCNSCDTVSGCKPQCNS